MITKRNTSGRNGEDPNSTNFLIDRAFRYRAVKIGVGIGLAFILTVVAVTGPEMEFSFYGVLTWIGHILSAVIKWCIGIIVAILLLGDTRAWFGTIRSLGLSSVLLGRRIYQLTERTKVKSHAHGWVMLLSGVGVMSALLLIWIFTGYEIFLWLAGFRFAFMLHEPIDNGRPPAVLLLGASAREVTTLQSEIEKAVRGNRVVSLLNLPSNAVVLSSEVHEWDVFRVPDEDDWERMVQELELITPIVVLDSRIMTNHVMRELKYMLDPIRSYKLVVVVDDKTHRISTDTFSGISLNRVCDKQQALTLLNGMTRSYMSLPKP